MIKIFLALLLLSISSGLSVLHADEIPSPFALPSPEPLAILALPSGSEQGKVSIAVSKALVAEKWENLGWDHNVTTATTLQSKIAIKVFAVANATDVKLYAHFSSEKNIPEDKCKKVALRELTYLEKAIAEALNLSFRKAKDDTIVDQAVP